MRYKQFIIGMIILVSSSILYFWVNNVINKPGSLLDLITPVMKLLGFGKYVSTENLATIMESSFRESFRQFQPVLIVPFLIGAGYIFYGLLYDVVYVLVTRSLKKQPNVINQNVEKTESLQPIQQKKTNNISKLSENILKFISSGTNTPESLVKKTGVDKSIMLNELEYLFLNEYITKDRFLTKKGYEYLHNNE